MRVYTIDENLNSRTQVSSSARALLFQSVTVVVLAQRSTSLSITAPRAARYHRSVDTDQFCRQYGIVIHTVGMQLVAGCTITELGGYRCVECVGRCIERPAWHHCVQVRRSLQQDWKLHSPGAKR